MQEFKIAMDNQVNSHLCTFFFICLAASIFADYICEGSFYATSIDRAFSAVMVEPSKAHEKVTPLQFGHFTYLNVIHLKLIHFNRIIN